MENRPNQASPRSRPQKKPSAGRPGVLKVRSGAAMRIFMLEAGPDTALPLITRWGRRLFNA